MRALILSTPLLVILSGLSGVAMFLPAAHASVLDDHHVAQAFLYSGVLILILTAMVGVATSNWRPRNVARSQLISLAGAYALLPVLFAVPLAQALPDTTFANAWFEMVSCFTTTGATLYDQPDRLTASLHLWRAFVGWMGGLFTLVTATAILAPMNLGGIEVISGRSPGRGADGLTQITRVADPAERFLRHTEMLLPIYAGLTVALWLLLMMAGEVNLVAVIHAMSTLSTSGIGMSGDLTVLTSGLWGEVLIFGFMALALTRRSLPGTTMVAAPGPLRRDPEVQLALVLLAVVTVTLFLRQYVAAIERSEGRDILGALRALWGAMFTAVSFLSTTGFQSGEWDSTRDWSGLGAPGLLLAGLAIIGGGVATTAGGVKLLRVYALFRHGERELERLVHPNSVGGSGDQARRLRREGAYFAWLFFMLFTLSVGVVVALLALLGLDFETALVLALSALTTTGQLAALGAENPISFADLSIAAKSLLAVAMVVGRLETLAVLALFSPSVWRR